MKKISLNGQWKLSGRLEGKENAEYLRLDATVPGCAQLDLMREGYLPEDIYMGMNTTELKKYEDYEWWYEKTLVLDKVEERSFLVFRAVDCIAEYFVNGKLIGESKNMFIPHEFPVSEYLHVGENVITVHIKSPTVYSNKLEYDISTVAISWHDAPESVAIRRAPHSYGWDIMPRAVTSGIWRDVYLEVRDEMYFTQTFFNYMQGNEYISGGLDFCYTLASIYTDFSDVEIEVEATSGDSKIYKRFPISMSAGKTNLPIESPKLWWPYGYGEPSVYDATVKIYKDGKPVHELKTSFGIRTVRLERTDATDGENGYFRFIVNGEEIMCKGSNWVPMDAFHSRDAERYKPALELVRDVGCNILRCWGGNVYEDHAFFDFCDRNGIMIWQDFAMACNSYPQNSEFFELIHTEATSIIREYRNHPSIILWSGDNEVDSMNWVFGKCPSENKVTREILPDAVRRNDPSRPYLQSSPYISDEANSLGYSSFPEWHLWGSRDYHKSDFHKHSKSHFVSETGYHGCPSLESIKKFITPERVWPYKDNPEWILHSSDQKGNPSRVDLMEYQVRQMFHTVPTDPEDYILASQISQAEAKKYFIERMRIKRPLGSGIIWWNLIDGWPQMSDAVVDYYYTKKLAYYYIKRSEAPFIIALDELYDRYQTVVAANDTLKDVSGRVEIFDADTKERLFSKEFFAPKNTSTKIGKVYSEYHDNRLLIIKWYIDGKEYFNHYVTGFIPYNLEKYKAWIGEWQLDK